MIRVAAVDIGTNSVHLLVAEVAPDGRISMVEKAREQVMLGSGGINDNRIADDAFARGVQALTEFHRAAMGLGVADVHAAATSAVREAENGQSFCRAVHEATGVHIRVISGHEEGRLIWLGNRDELDFSHGPVLLCDLGGGSTELILAEPGELRLVNSLPAGHIRMADAFPSKGALDADARRAMKKNVRALLDPVKRRVPKGHAGAMVGTSGTIRTLAKMATLARGDAQPAHAQGLVLARSEVEDFISRFLTMTKDDLDGIPGFDPKRRETLPAGAVVVREVMKAFGLDILTTSERSLRDGLVVDWIERHRPEIDLSRDLDDPRERSLVLTRERFGVDAAHADHVTRLALSLYDQLGPVHQLPIPDRGILDAAAQLHDIGHHIDPKGHHKHGQYLIENIKLAGYTAPEIALLGNIVRYHSRSTPKGHHPAWRALDTDARHRVRVLAGMLKIADALDRGHDQAVASVRVDTSAGAIRIVGLTADNGTLEQWAAKDRTKLLEKALGRKVVVEVAPLTAAEEEVA